MRLISILQSIFIFSLLTSIVTAKEVDVDDLLYMTENYKPYNYVENNQLKGISVDLLKLMWKDMGYSEQKINVFPWSRGYKFLQTKTNSVLFGTARTEERENLFKWVCPITSNKYVLISKKESKIKINTLDDARKYIIGSIRDDIAEQFLLNYNFNKIKSVNNIIQNLKKLNAGRIDLIAYGESSMFNTMNENGYNIKDYETVYTLKESQVCYAFHKDTSEKIIQKFQNAIDNIVKQPIYNKLNKKYF